jgi:hypothetical protein
MFVAAGDFREQLTDAGANMHAGAFSAQGQAAADGHNTTDRLDRGNAGGVTRPPLFQLVFDMRNAAATGLWREASNHPSGDAGGKCGASENEKESGHAISVSPLRNGIAQIVGSLQAQPEGSANQARDNTDDD